MFVSLTQAVLSATLATAACVPTTPPPTTPPPSGSVRLHPNGNTNWCLEVQGNRRENGAPVQLANCGTSSGQAWVIQKGSTQVKLAGSSFCLDAGSSPGNGVKSKIWTCYTGLAAQKWWYTDDNRIALEGKGQCVDLPSGGLWAGNVAQTWQCSNGNTNQVWTTSSAPAARRDLEERMICEGTSLTPGGRKAGLAGGNAFDQLKDYIGWWYDWTGVPSGHSGAPIAIPMLWGNGHRGSVQNDAARFRQFTSTWSASNPPKYVLGFNEPDCTSGESASMSVGESVTAWNQYLAPLGNAGSLLVSPAMCAQLHESFLTPFTQQISTPYDVVAVHIFKPDIAQVRAVLDYFWNKYGKPMWVTEFGCVYDQNGFNGCWDQGQAVQFMKDAVATFQNDGRVYAYAPTDVGNAWTMTSGTQLTEVGKAYLNAVRQYA
ncbi:hypothetical protein CspeluHIS016_0505700 [Cutaneotrichosporon spelunceum]|uniref:Ricin B lectin domain-containing protein n=1 Tax=Cutaneotrichosporon spelunceum TaxID=1672016 RepID=A0AAD3YDW5_9TREE|nr:hypothetical protein CspeluHIS016_0505700 [Cutaneotrichosporon spelunceum]